MRHLYAFSSEPGMSHIIEQAKLYERRRCGHLPSDYPVPLSAQSCITSVVDPKNKGINKHRYVVASQDLDVRKVMRNLMGVPLVYINRSVMIMEPMAGRTTESIAREEQVKLRAGIKRPGSSLKRKRDEKQDEDQVKKREDEFLSMKKVARGPKGPNPLSVKKPSAKTHTGNPIRIVKNIQESSTDVETKKHENKEVESFAKRRRRKHKSRSVKEQAVVISDIKSNN